MANRTDRYVEGKFLHEVDPKDGFPVKECRNARECRLLEFLVSIVHSDKPTWVTRTLENTIFGATSGERLVDWAKIFAELVNRLVGEAGKSKPTPIYPFFYHLYESKGLLKEDEETDYRAVQELTRYQITVDRDPDSHSEVLRITRLSPPHVVAPVNRHINSCKEGICIQLAHHYRLKWQELALEPPINLGLEPSRPLRQPPSSLPSPSFNSPVCTLLTHPCLHRE